MMVLDFLRRFGLVPSGMFRSRRLLDLANHAPCMHCTSHIDGAVVSAHANWSEHGKGGSIKAHDCFVAFLCTPCHAWVDQARGSDPTGVYSNSADDRKAAWLKAYAMTMLYLFHNGKVVVR